MGAILKSIDDPRDSLQKTRRIEMAKYAEAHGIKEIDPRMPADLMREILRGKGISSIPIPNRVLGMTPGNALPVETTEPVKVVDALDDLKRQWQEQVSVESMSITQLRQECKRRGIKLARTDNMQTLRAKLNENAA